MDVGGSNSPAETADNITQDPVEPRATIAGLRVKQDADFIFHELTRSICPQCKAVIDAQIIIRDNKVFMRKRCPQPRLVRRHHQFRRPNVCRCYKVQ